MHSSDITFSFPFQNRLQEMLSMHRRDYLNNLKATRCRWLEWVPSQTKSPSYTHDTNWESPQNSWPIAMRSKPTSKSGLWKGILDVFLYITTTTCTYLQTRARARAHTHTHTHTQTHTHNGMRWIISAFAVCKCNSCTKAHSRSFLCSSNSLTIPFPKAIFYLF